MQFFVVFSIFITFAAVKQLAKYRKYLLYTLAVLMVTAIVSRLYITHEREYYENFLRTPHLVHDHDAMVSCNCPICHAEDYLAIEVEPFVYRPFIAVLECDHTVQPVARENKVVVVSLLRGPPCLS